MQFDLDALMRQMKRDALTLIDDQIIERLTTLRCEQHPESRIAVRADGETFQISIPRCCDEFKQSADAALEALGAKPNEEGSKVVIAEVATPVQPLAFISYSSADLERIARPLDKLLRERGIRVWLDKRDLLPGRNLIDEIFKQGISRADAFIVILSKNSINSNWVHEELTNAVVQRIDGVVKIVIPVILDDVSPPEFLKQTVWEVIRDENLPLHADRIAAAIIGLRAAPVAPAPQYAGIPVHRLGSLTAEDELMFVAACKQLLDSPSYYPVVSFPQLFAYGKTIGLTEEQVEESLQALETRGYFRNVLHGLGERFAAGGRLSDHGLEQYLLHYDPEGYRAAKITVVSAIVNRGAHLSSIIAQESGIHEIIVEHIISDLERGDHIIASHHNQGISIGPKPTLRRVLRSLEGD